MNSRSLLAILVFIAAGTGTTTAQETPLIKEGEAEVDTLVDALAPPRKPVRTRSIRIARDDVGTPAVAPAPARVSLQITFETNSATLTPRARQSLDVVGQALASDRLGTFRFGIEGHADPRGAPAANLTLSQLRARAVRSYLVEHLKIDPARLEAVGKGDREPVNASNPDAPENRRVTIVNLSR